MNLFIRQIVKQKLLLNDNKMYGLYKLHISVYV